MNFKIMPELSWEYGYYYALVVMLLAGILPVAYFKWKKWF
jgi:magnesium transporter